LKADVLAAAKPSLHLTARTSAPLGFFQAQVWGQTTRIVKFLCTYMGRTSNGRKPFRFLWNQSAALASNLYLLLFPKGPLQAALRADSQLFAAVFQALRQIDTDAFIREGRVYGGGLYKMEPKELGRLAAEPVVEAMGGWQPVRQGTLFTDR